MKKETQLVVTIVSVFVICIILSLWGCPQYQVYTQRMDGEAQLAHSHASRQVQIQDAQSKLEAAKSLAAAEVERARGVAEANKIIGSSLKNNEEYLRYLWIHNLEQAEKTGQVIYVPTEAGLPILEAGKRRQ